MFDENIVIGPDWDFFMKYSDLANFGYINRITCLYRLHTTNISVRVGLERRALELAKCRINAIRMKNFGTCSDGIRTAVFYDLLVNLLLDSPEMQSDVTRWPQFLGLPESEQARLLRLMATKTIIYGKDQSYVRVWLQQARRLNPRDWRAALLSFLFDIDARLLGSVLKLRSGHGIDPRLIPPFIDMKLDGNR